MTEILSRITENVSIEYYCRQVVAILVLFIVGIAIINLLNVEKANGNMKSIKHSLSDEHMFLLAFPVGLSAFSICGLILLILNIKYSAVTIIIFLTAVILLIIFYAKKRGYIGFNVGLSNKKLLAYSAIVIMLALVATSGIISIGYSNDSMYYYSAYPHEIVNRSGIWEVFDVFLTDAGQTTAIINTIPFMFGFNETFGIHTFFNINFICLFFYVVYEKSTIYFESRKSAAIAIVSTLLLITSMPYVFVSKWIIANMYFMGYAFILLYINNKFKEEENTIYMRALLLAMLSFVRIEGALYAGLIMLVYMMQDNIKKKSVIVMVMPAAILQACYYVRIFALMNIKAVYSFMTWPKAIVAVVFLLAIIIYSLFVSVDTKFPAIKERFKILNPVFASFSALIAVNIGLFLYDRRIFISNVKVFLGNVLKNSGWGFFVAVIVVLIALVPKVKIKTLYYEYFCIGFILVSFAACFARGDGLRVDLFDSSNRVMLQIVPFIVYALANRYIEAYGTINRE